MSMTYPMAVMRFSVELYTISVIGTQVESSFETLRSTSVPLSDGESGSLNLWRARVLLEKGKEGKV